MFCLLFVFIYVHLYSDVQHDFHIRRCLCRLTVMHTTGATSGSDWNYLLYRSINEVGVVQSLVFCVVFCRPLIVCMSLFLLVIVL